MLLVIQPDQTLNQWGSVQETTLSFFSFPSPAAVLLLVFFSALFLVFDFHH